MSLELVNRNGRRYAQFARMAALPGLVHAFSTRPFDVSPRADAHAAQRAARRAQMCADFELEDARLHHCLQCHTPEIVRVNAQEPGGPHVNMDGLITAASGVGLMTFSADCPLVLVYDPATPALGMVHASWRCTVAGATTRLIQMMQDAFGSRPATLFAGIGPSAGPTMYEVGDDVYDAAENLPQRGRLFERRGDKWLFNLWRANADQLESAGVPAAQIEIAEVCTMTNAELFYSFRREGPGCGHFGLLAALRAE